MNKVNSQKKAVDSPFSVKKDSQLNFQLCPWEQKNLPEINFLKNNISIDEIAQLSFFNKNKSFKNTPHKELTKDYEMNPLTNKRPIFTRCQIIRNQSFPLKKKRQNAHKSFHNYYNSNNPKILGENIFSRQEPKQYFRKRKYKNKEQILKIFEGKNKENKKCLTISKTTILAPKSQKKISDSNNNKQFPVKNSFQYKLSYSNILRYGKLGKILNQS